MTVTLTNKRHNTEQNTLIYVDVRAIMPYGTDCIEVLFRKEFKPLVVDLNDWDYMIDVEG